MMWYFEDYKRYRSEREGLDLLSSRESWLTPLGWRIDSAARVIWDADISTAAGNRSVSLRYPNHFPHSPPLVLPRVDSTRWSQHQYGAGGELCLEFGPDNWHPDITGADMIASAHRLLQGEHPAPDVAAEVASRHLTSIGQDLRGAFSRFVITRTLESELAEIEEPIVLPATEICVYRGDSLVHLIATLVLPTGREWKDQLPNPQKLGFERPTAVVVWPDTEPLPSGSLSGFRTTAVLHNLAIPDVTYVLLVKNSQFYAYFLHTELDTILKVSTIRPAPYASRLDHDHLALAERKVAIVGCGSLGSKIAVSLARSGVGRFLLVDDDILLPDNLVRHDLDWREVGTHKVESVADKIQLVNAGAACEVRKHLLGGQESSGAVEGLIESLGTCDLIIDATADSGVFNYLCAAVAVFKKPLVWAEVFGGGFGGMIARHRPLIEPSPAAMRRAIEDWCAVKGKPMPRPAQPYAGPQVPAIADDADVTVLGAHATRLAIDSLIPRQPSIFSHAAYMVGLAEGWIFDQPFETHPITIEQSLAQAPEEPTDVADARIEFERIASLFKAYIDGTAANDASNQTVAG